MKHLAAAAITVLLIATMLACGNEPTPPATSPPAASTSEVSPTQATTTDSPTQLPTTEMEPTTDATVETPPTEVVATVETPPTEVVATVETPPTEVVATVETPPTEVVATVETPPMTDGPSIPESLLTTLSADEQKCLEQDFTPKDTNMNPEAEILKCLSEENQFALYMSQVEAGDQLSEETHRCIWNSIAGLQDIADQNMESTMDPDHGANLMGQMMSAFVMVPIYCAATHESDFTMSQIPSGDDTPAPDLAEIEQIVCMIDNAGGLDEWIHTIFTDMEEFERIMNESETACNPPPAG